MLKGLLEGLDEGKIAALKDAPAHEIEQVIQNVVVLIDSVGRQSYIGSRVTGF